MTEPWKGGKGKKASYATTHARIPEAIKGTVEALSTAWKRMTANDRDTSELLHETKALIAEIYYPSDDKPLTGKTQNIPALEIDQMRAEIAILKESIAAKETEIKLLQTMTNRPDISSLKTYKLHGKEVVKVEDLKQLLAE